MPFASLLWLISPNVLVSMFCWCFDDSSGEVGQARNGAQTAQSAAQLLARLACLKPSAHLGGLNGEACEKDDKSDLDRYCQRMGEVRW